MEPEIAVETPSTSSPPSTPTEAKTFLDLNDDCILEILEFLSLEDLNSMSQVCKRVYGLSDSIYMRKHLEDTEISIQFSSMVNGRPVYVLEYNNDFPKRFGPEVIPNYFVYCDITNDLFEFLRSKCCPNLKRIEFCYGPNERVDGELIKSQLRTVEYLGVYWLGDGDVHDSLLQYCTDLKNLEMYVYGRMDTNANWLNQIYPKLTYLKFFGSFEPPKFGAVGSFKHFIELNSQLEAIECHPLFIRSMMPTLPKMKRLKVHEFWRESGEMLKTLRNSRSVEWLEIDAFACENIDALAELKSLRALYSVRIGRRNVQGQMALQRMHQLQELELIDPCEKVLCIANTLPNLVKIKIRGAYTHKMNTTRMLLKFAKNTKNLKQIKWVNYKSKITMDSLMEMDAIRSMCPGAGQISVIFDGASDIFRDSLQSQKLADMKSFRIKFV